jgi:protease IV
MMDDVTLQPIRPRRPGLFALWLLLPLIIGILLALAIPQPVVGVIRLNDAIYAQTAQDLNTQIAYVSRHPEIKAVVLVLDSPGGTVAGTESVYMELASLRQTRPVISVIESMAASGAYYLASGTDYIFCKPTSDVGNIGVIGYLPDFPQVYEGIISTGPYKLWGGRRDTTTRQIEMVKQGFYQAVKLGRASALKIPPENLLSGEIWPGTEALRIGLVDALGSESQAVTRAAQMAHISHYEVAELSDLADISQTPAQILGFFAKLPDGSLSPYPQESGLYMLYIPPSKENQP